MDGHVAAARADGPTLERQETRYPYRSLYLSFGFEGINDDTGYTTREELMGALLNWLTDELMVSLDPAEGVTHDVIALDATVTSSVDAEGVQYRWDFGDGSEIAITATPSAVHVYESAGMYLARVQVTDEYGHTAVSVPVVVEVGTILYLPVVMKNAP